MIREVIEILKYFGLPAGSGIGIVVLGYVGYRVYMKRVNGSKPPKPVKVTEEKCEERMTNMRQFIIDENHKQNETQREQVVAIHNKVEEYAKETSKSFQKISFTLGEIKGMIKKE